MLTKNVETFEPNVTAPPTYGLLSHYHDGNIAVALFIVLFWEMSRQLHDYVACRLSMHRDTKPG
jgi:hypothetical protein